jgi:3-deoxy-D-manno-octulosonic-acid transferase
MFLNLCYALALWWLFPWLLWRALHTGRYRRWFSSRFLGLVPLPRHRLTTKCVWFHGVSVGEIHLLIPLVQAFRKRFPDWQIVVSASTDSGLDEAGKRFADLTVIPWPWDFTWAVGRVLDIIQPRLVVLAESELWPNFLQAARRRQIPVCVVNGRISPRTARRWGRWPDLVRRLLLQPITHFAVQNEVYAERLRELGVPSDKISVTGSIKYDGALHHQPEKTQELARWLGVSWPRQHPSEVEDVRSPVGSPILWLAGSTHPPEEEIVLRVFADLRCRYPRLHLLLVPRHPDRFEAVAQLVASTGLTWVRRSRHPQPLASLPAVILWDTIGELQAAWGLADLGFVGGSLDGRRGGQSMIEPAGQGVPCLFGPHVWNFREPAEQLVERGAAILIPHAVDLAPQVEQLLQDPQRRRRMGQIAQEFVRSQQGAVQRTLQVLENVLKPQTPHR